MGKTLSFIHFQSLPVKVRKSAVAHVLANRFNYSIEGEGKKFERAYLKALIDFQKSVGLGGNGVICEKTFECLSPVTVVTSK
jgi:murein L,D-transpeptidase YcbB/YkuD